MYVDGSVKSTAFNITAPFFQQYLPTCPTLSYIHRCLGTTVLADAWCKVRAMNQANSDYPDVKLFIYMDSDAVVDKAYVNVSVVSKVAEIQRLLQVSYAFSPVSAIR